MQLLNAAAIVSEFRARILAATHDAGAVEAQWGAVTGWQGFEAVVASPVAPYAAVILERACVGACGVRAELASPLSVAWRDVCVLLGAPETLLMSLDDWGGPTPYRFDLAAPDRNAYLIVEAHHAESGEARISALIGRWQLLEAFRDSRAADPPGPPVTSG